MSKEVVAEEAQSVGRRCRDLLASVLPRPVEIEAGSSHVVVNGTVLRVAWADDGWLPDVRRVLDTMGDRPQIVAARRLSPGARAALTQAGIGWVDETGAAEIAVGTIVVVQPVCQREVVSLRYVRLPISGCSCMMLSVGEGPAGDSTMVTACSMRMRRLLRQGSGHRQSESV